MLVSVSTWFRSRFAGVQTVTGPMTQDVTSTETIWIEDATAAPSADIEFLSPKEVLLTDGIVLEGEFEIEVNPEIQ